MQLHFNRLHQLLALHHNLMSSEFSVIIVNSITIGAGLVGIVGIWLARGPDEQTRHRLPLSLILGLLVVDCISTVLELAGLADPLGAMEILSFVVIAPLPALIWQYVSLVTAATHPDTDTRKGHWLIVVFNLLLLLPSILLPTDARNALSNGETDAVSVVAIIAVLALVVFVLMWIGHMIWVGVATYRRLSIHRSRLRDALSETQGLDLRWIDGFAVFLIGAILLQLAEILFTMATLEGLLGTIGTELFILCVVAGLSIFGLKQNVSAPKWLQALTEEIDKSTGDQAGYNRSSLSEDDCRDLAERLDTLMRDKQPWRDPFLNLKTLAQLVGTKPHYVTQTLSTQLGRNFYAYVNGWRVEEVARLLLESDENVLAISEEAGFNSKSTFNTIFRKEKGVTPSAYRTGARARPTA